MPCASTTTSAAADLTSYWRHVEADTASALSAFAPDNYAVVVVDV